MQSLKESILTANVKAVYGEPIAAQGRTVIPVAKVIYGYGGGAGTGGVGNSGTRGEGGGGAGGARSIPVGVVEVSDQQTRFVPISDRKKLAGAVASQVKAHWQGQTLVTEEKGPNGEKISHTYELSSEGKFIDTLTVESKKLNAPVIVRSVYDKT